MCGIIGYKGNLSNKVKDFLGIQKHRGEDSFGAIIIKTNETRGIKDINKMPFIRALRRENGAKYTLIHHRKASIGSININTAHPIIGESTFTIHNGTKRDIYDIMKSIVDSDTQAIAKILDRKFNADEVTKALFDGVGVVFSINTDQNLFVHVDGKRSLFINKDRSIFSSEPVCKGEWFLIKEQHKIYNSAEDFMRNTEIYNKSISVVVGDLSNTKKCASCNSTHIHRKGSEVCIKCEVLDKKAPKRSYYTYRYSSYFDDNSYYDNKDTYFEGQIVEFELKNKWTRGIIEQTKSENNEDLYLISYKNSGNNKFVYMHETSIRPATERSLKIGKEYYFTDFDSKHRVKGILKKVNNSERYPYTMIKTNIGYNHSSYALSYAKIIEM